MLLTEREIEEEAAAAAVVPEMPDEMAYAALRDDYAGGVEWTADVGVQERLRLVARYDRMARRAAAGKSVTRRARTRTPRVARVPRARRRRRVSSGGAKKSARSDGDGDGDSAPARPRTIQPPHDPTPPPPLPLPLLTTRQIARYLSISEQSVRMALVAIRRGGDSIVPPPIRLGSHTPRWRLRDVDAWLDERRGRGGVDGGVK